MLDTRYAVETPEGGELLLHPAGIGPRVLAYLIDLLIRGLLFLVLALGLGWAGGLGKGLAAVGFFALEWFYPVFFDLFKGGVSPGKKRLRLRTVQDDGTPVTFGASLLRNLLRVVDFLPMAYLAGLATMVCNGTFKRLGDLAAGTLVVYEPDPFATPQIDEAGSRALNLPLSTEEQKQIIAFAERCPQLSEERARELAAQLSPLLGAQEPDPVRALKQVANGLVGQR